MVRFSADLWKEIDIGDFHIVRTSNHVSTLDGKLESGPVIAGIYGSFSVPAHFIVIKEKDDGEYIMNDPWYEDANNIKLTEYYEKSDITRVDTVSIY